MSDIATEEHRNGADGGLMGTGLMGTGLMGSVGAALFVATMLFYFVSLHPFVDLTAAASTDPAASRTDILNQIVFLGLTGMLWLYALCSPMRGEVAQPRMVLGVTIAWFALVSVISDHPDLALKRVILAFLTCVNATILLLLPRSPAQFARLVALCCLVTLAVAYFGVVFLPSRAIHQFAELREPMNAGLWRGHFPHKNAAAISMVLLSFFGIYVFQAGLRLRGLVILVLAVFFLVKSGGKTAAAALPATLIVAWLFERLPALRIPIVCGGILAINALTLGAATSDGVRGILTDLGIDPTFTNRTDIWQVGVNAAEKRPITGYGFQLFWQTEEVVYSAGRGADWAAAAFNGHNAYLDSVVTTGLVGLVLTLVWIVFVPLQDSFAATARGGRNRLSRLYTNIWLYGVFTACLESIFFSSGSGLWVCMLMAVFGLRLQARAVVVEEPAPSGAARRWLDVIASDLRRWGRSRRRHPAAVPPRSLRR